MISPDEIYTPPETPEILLRCTDCPALCILQERLADAQKDHKKLIGQLAHAATHPEEVEQFARLILSGTEIPSDQYDEVLHHTRQLLGSSVDQGITTIEETIESLISQIQTLPDSCEGTLSREETDDRGNVYDISICTSDDLYRKFGDSLHAPAHVLSHAAADKVARQRAAFLDVITALSSIVEDDSNN